MNVILLRHTEQPEEVLATAAAACVGKPNGTIKSAQGAIKSGHESLLEHISFTFRVDGVSRTLLAQLTRHRHASFSVESQRYVPYHDGFGYTTPPQIKADDEHRQIFESQMETMTRWYDGWLTVLGDEGAEDARFVLPNACNTSLIMTMNGRQLKHFLGLRLCNRAQWEIRALANQMLKLTLPHLPNIFTKHMAKCDQLGFCTERKSCGRKPKLDDILACWEKYGEEWKNGNAWPDKIKKGLECCGNNTNYCRNDCPCLDGCHLANEFRQMERDALAYIQQLERERDAAVTDVKSLCATISFSGTYCEYCKYNEEDGQCHHPCKPYSSEWGWEWRGVKEDER